MATVLMKSSLGQAVPMPYSAGLVIGPPSETGLCGFRHTLHRLPSRPRPPGPNVESFAALALTVYMADKAFARWRTEDAWTRDLDASVGVGSGFLPALPILTEALCFLSGDRWQLNTHGNVPPVGPCASYGDFAPHAVCLFSGGIDSLAGAIDLVEGGARVILVSHFEKGTDGHVQRLLAGRLISEYGSERVLHVPVQVCAAESVEKSTRTRSLLFIALALMVASAFGDEVPIYIPENGFVGLNIPLTGSRVGSYSTRTTHPSYLAAVRHALRAASIGHPILNPYGCLSKGGVVQSCGNAALLRRLVPLTLSCAKAGALRWAGRSPARNCGRCYPCLMRRAALHSIGADDASDYVYDAIGGEDMLYAPRLGMDLRCLLQAVYRLRRPGASPFLELLRTGSLSSLRDAKEPLPAIQAGLVEFAALVSDKGCNGVRTYVSL